MAMPIFADGRLLGFACNIAHHADMGGMAPGSMAGGMSDIYQEGLRIPVVRLFRAGVLQQDLLDLVLLNVRAPEERRGDYFAQVAACRLGRRRLLDAAATFGAAVLETAFAEIIERTARRMREAVAKIPDATYRFEDLMDDDGLGSTDIPIRLRIDVAGNRVRFDFAGSAAQVPGNINVTRNATQASVCYALKALLDPDVPNNQGMLDLPEISVPRGSLLDAAFPAPVAARANTCQRIIDAIIGALAEALPDRAVGAANGANTTAVFSGVDPRSGRPYVYLETLGGGFGGRAGKDGKDGVQAHITNTSNLPVEAIETEYPLRVESYGLIEDSGGAGRHRGGLGLRRVVRPVGHDCEFNGAGERFAHRPWGVFGGEPGGVGRFALIDADGDERVLAAKPAGVRVGDGERVVVESPGAGGYGPAADRPQALLDEDRRSGKFSAAYLARHYGGRAEDA